MGPTAASVLNLLAGARPENLTSLDGAMPVMSLIANLWHRMRREEPCVLPEDRAAVNRWNALLGSGDPRRIELDILPGRPSPTFPEASGGAFPEASGGAMPPPADCSRPAVTRPKTTIRTARHAQRGNRCLTRALNLNHLFPWIVRVCIVSLAS